MAQRKPRINRRLLLSASERNLWQGWDQPGTQGAPRGWAAGGRTGTTGRDRDVCMANTGKRVSIKEGGRHAEPLAGWSPALHVLGYVGILLPRLHPLTAPEDKTGNSSDSNDLHLIMPTLPLREFVPQNRAGERL